MEKIKLKTGSNRNQCPGCGELFNSLAAFDRHRHGQYGRPDTGHPGDYMPANRKCYTPEQMIGRGMVKNATEWWCSSLYEYPAPGLHDELESNGII